MNVTNNRNECQELSWFSALSQEITMRRSTPTACGSFDVHVRVRGRGTERVQTGRRRDAAAPLVAEQPAHRISLIEGAATRLGDRPFS